MSADGLRGRSVTPAWGQKVTLERSDRIRWSANESDIHINNVRTEDGGLYQVEVSNERGTFVANFTIDVLCRFIVK